jgi:YgiT-type zinc finger domain-containing protein
LGIGNWELVSVNISLSPLFSLSSLSTKKVKRQQWLCGRLYIIENVEAEVCTECGERYFHATTLDAIDQYLSAEHPVKEEMNVEVVSLG